MEDYDWIRYPFSSLSSDSSQKLTLKEKEDYAELWMDRTMKMKFGEASLDVFWLTAVHEYPTISDHAIAVFLPFPTTYLCELAFSTLA